MKKINENEIMKLSKIAAIISLNKLKLLDIYISDISSVISAQKVYESILQCYLFCGFPAVLESLKIFNKHFQGFSMPPENYNFRKFKLRGVRNCKLVYRNNFKKLIENVELLSPDLKNWMIIEGYGKVMGRPGLSMLEREFINVAILSAQYYENQLHSHFKGAIFAGATEADLKNLIKEIEPIIGKGKSAKCVGLLVKIGA